MKSIEKIYNKPNVSYSPEHYRYIKSKLRAEIGNERENLKAYKMVCESCKPLTVNIVLVTLLLSVSSFLFNVLPKELLIINIKISLSPYIGHVLFWAIIAIVVFAINMSIKEKKCEQILIILKDIEEEMFGNDFVETEAEHE